MSRAGNARGHIEGTGHTWIDHKLVGDRTEEAGWCLCHGDCQSTKESRREFSDPSSTGVEQGRQHVERRHLRRVVRMAVSVGDSQMQCWHSRTARISGSNKGQRREIRGEYTGTPPYPAVIGVGNEYRSQSTWHKGGGGGERFS